MEDLSRYKNLVLFSKRKKYKFIIDKNLCGLGKYIRNLGYVDVNEISDSRSDIEINKELNSIGSRLSTKPVLLITKYYDDFIEFTNRQYFILGIKEGYTFEKISNKLSNLLSSGNFIYRKGAVEIFTK